MDGLRDVYKLENPLDAHSEYTRNDSNLSGIPWREVQFSASIRYEHILVPSFVITYIPLTNIIPCRARPTPHLTTIHSTVSAQF